MSDSIDLPMVSSPFILCRLFSRFSLTALRVCASPSCNSIERIEQMAETSLSPSIYPRLSLGPGQRFASRGGYILGFPHGAATPVPVSDWLIP
ncbi:MAG: hypothetical protein Q7T65_07180 [Thiobacillus sp.]|nr:hypothetical protein [Thiobacillus sp.]